MEKKKFSVKFYVAAKIVVPKSRIGRLTMDNSTPRKRNVVEIFEYSVKSVQFFFFPRFSVHVLDVFRSHSTDDSDWESVKFTRINYGFIAVVFVSNASDERWLYAGS